MSEIKSWMRASSNLSLWLLLCSSSLETVRQHPAHRSGGMHGDRCLSIIFGGPQNGMQAQNERPRHCWHCMNMLSLRLRNCAKLQQTHLDFARVISPVPFDQQTLGLLCERVRFVLRGALQLHTYIWAPLFALPRCGQGLE